ncbi:hypothetical protein EZV73_01830 [Acidaminobacter sp. JC074]|uniref:hypothetical protein n=1 Tax=Acidaminobacter sp. JC074 TaxID=2530199 RepID=UPI001F108328|nr:hypothetical protein [Acidaminobacter sp. JC074]MCH4886285.1 hypothetical protein [Acidaminobacter sp. JC074]
MKLLKIVSVILIFYLLLVVILLNHQGISYSFSAKRVIDYLEFDVDSNFQRIRIEKSLILSEPKEISNEDFKESYAILKGLEYHFIKEIKDNTSPEDDHIIYYMTLVDEHKKRYLYLVEDGILVHSFHDDDVNYIKLYVDEKRMKQLLDELRRSN